MTLEELQEMAAREAARRGGKPEVQVEQRPTDVEVFRGELVSVGHKAILVSAHGDRFYFVAPREIQRRLGRCMHQQIRLYIPAADLIPLDDDSVE